MKSAFLLLLVGIGASCSGETHPSISSLRCPPGGVLTAAPDMPISSTDASLFGVSRRDNPYNCINDPTVCSLLGSAFRCDTLAGCCVEIPLGRCTKSSDCIGAHHPVCDLTNHLCVACSTADSTLGNQQCANWNTAQQDPLNRGLCINGACAECRTSADCTRLGKNFCDQTDNICKGCTSHAQCTGSNLCKLDEKYLATGDTLSNIGECVKPTDVAFVDNTTGNCNSGGPGTSTKPFCEIYQAVASGKSYINVAGHGGAVAALYQSVAVGAGQRVVILGPGRDVSYNTSAAVLNGFSVTGGGQAALIGISVTNSTNQPAVQCSGASTLFVENALIWDRTYVPSGGIYSVNCTQVDVSRTKINAVDGYGISITGGTAHRVVNNAIINNGNVSAPAGLRLSGGADGLFAFNTIANNRQGVQCDTQAIISDSIAITNMATPQISASCTQTRTVLSGVELDPTYQTGNDPRLTANPINNSCIDKGMPDSNRTIKDDYYGTKRPLGPGFDIGCHEAR